MSLGGGDAEGRVVMQVKYQKGMPLSMSGNGPFSGPFLISSPTCLLVPEIGNLKLCLAACWDQIEELICYLRMDWAKVGRRAKVLMFEDTATRLDQRKNRCFEKIELVLWLRKAGLCSKLRNLSPDQLLARTPSDAERSIAWESAPSNRILVYQGHRGLYK